MISEVNRKENDTTKTDTFAWDGEKGDLCSDPKAQQACLLAFDDPVFAVMQDGAIQLTNTGKLIDPFHKQGMELLGHLPPIHAADFGDAAFCTAYDVRAAYYAGGMANAIASEKMVITLAKGGLMGSFGSGGLSLERVREAVETIRSQTPGGQYLFNLLHNPFDPEMEQRTVELYLEQEVRAVEAAAFIRLTPAIVQYRAGGLSRDPSGNILIKNHVIAKISRREIALLFLNPAPDAILTQLSDEGKITKEQAELARQVPMADDIAVEADSGGHTDNQPLVVLLPSIIALRDRTQTENKFKQPVRIGAGGGISTPESMLAAFMMGAAFVVTGSVNQACIESGACEHTRKLLADADMADVCMAPSADMFELGARVQVLKKGSLFPMRAQKLYDLYMSCKSIEEIPPAVRKELETRIFKKDIDEIWQETKVFFEKRNPQQIIHAEKDPRKKMALVFRWYLGQSSRWSRDGVEDRRMDYQIWCGPSIGGFNEWTKGTYLEEYTNREVADVAWQMLKGCQYSYRVLALKMQGVILPPEVNRYSPKPMEKNR